MESVALAALGMLTLATSMAISVRMFKQHYSKLMATMAAGKLARRHTRLRVVSGGCSGNGSCVKWRLVASCFNKNILKP